MLQQLDDKHSVFTKHDYQTIIMDKCFMVWYIIYITVNNFITSETRRFLEYDVHGWGSRTKTPPYQATCKRYKSILRMHMQYGEASTKKECLLVEGVSKLLKISWLIHHHHSLNGSTLTHLSWKSKGNDYVKKKICKTLVESKKQNRMPIEHILEKSLS